MTYIKPKYNEKKFTCPYCGTLAEQTWSVGYAARKATELKYNFSNDVKCEEPNIYINIDLAISICNGCYNHSIWVDKKLLKPKILYTPEPIDGMPEKVKELYEEARNVYDESKKAAAALLRLAVQYLCIELGGYGENVNSDIGKLVKEKKLSIQIQKALDIVRVIGNNAVHPGVLDFKDDGLDTIKLFELVNIIVESQIIQYKKINGLYASLPQEALKRIEKRDAKINKKNSI